MTGFFDVVRQGFELIGEKIEEIEVRREKKVDQMREELRDIYEDQIDDTNQQMNYERHKLAMECEDLKDKFHKLERKSNIRMRNFKAEIQRLKSENHRMRFFLTLAACVGCLLAMKHLHLALTFDHYFIISLTLIIVFVMKQN